jgi:hypothetical protein
MHFAGLWRGTPVEYTALCVTLEARVINNLNL